MTLQKIQVLIVDDFADTRDSISKLLYFERDIEVVGTACDGQDGIQKARDLRPDVILMDINMPVMDGIAATEQICSTLPECEVIMMSVQGESDYLRRAMLAGAREYLVKPFSGDELAGSIRHVHELSSDKRARLVAATQPAVLAPIPEPVVGSTGRVISVFSPKGGVGRTTIACNLAVALRAMTGKKVALVDCNLLFGDVGITLNLSASKTMSDLVPSISVLDQDLVDSILATHPSGVKVLMGPPRPELAELINGEHLRGILGFLKQRYEYVVVDTFASFEDTMLAVLDVSDRILLLTTLEMPAIKNIRLFLEVSEALHYGQEKVMLVLNRSDSTGGIRIEDIEQSIRFKVSASIVSSGQLMTTAVNQGVPIVTSHPESEVAKNILGLAKAVLTETDLSELVSTAKGKEKDSREAKPGLSLPKLRLSPFGHFAPKKGAS